MSTDHYSVELPKRSKEQLDEDKKRCIDNIIEVSLAICMARANLGVNIGPFPPLTENQYIEDLEEQIMFLEEILDEEQGVTFHRNNDETYVKHWYSAGKLEKYLEGR